MTLTVEPDTGRLIAPCHGVYAVVRCMAAGIDRWRTLTALELDDLYHLPTLSICCLLCGRSCQP